MWSQCAVLTFLLIQASCALPAQESLYSNIENYITDGEDAKVGEFPYQVSISWGMDPVFRQRHVCGGTIVHKKWILTSATCAKVLPRWGTTKVRAGINNLDDNAEVGQTSDVLVRLIHNDYDRMTLKNDVALLKLEKELDLKDQAALIRLPVNYKKAAVEKAILTGWGSKSKGLIARPSNTLQKAEVAIIPNDVCQEALNSLTLKRQINKNQICSGPLEGTVSACGIGDLGSPLAQIKNNVAEIIGIVSWSRYPCGKPGMPTIYTRVAAFTEWIQSRINEAP